MSRHGLSRKHPLALSSRCRKSFSLVSGYSVSSENNGTYYVEEPQNNNEKLFSWPHSLQPYKTITIFYKVLRSNIPMLQLLTTVKINLDILYSSLVYYEWNEAILFKYMKWGRTYGTKMYYLMALM